MTTNTRTVLRTIFIVALASTALMSCGSQEDGAQPVTSGELPPERTRQEWEQSKAQTQVTSSEILSGGIIFGCNGTPGLCVPPETTVNCPRDCNTCVQNGVIGVCDPTETHASCPRDCPESCGQFRDVCTVGTKLGRSCAPEVNAVCQVDAYCCDTAWDGWCVEEIWTVAGRNTCGGWTTARLPVAACTEIYTVGTPKVFGCGPAVDFVCNLNASCCGNFPGNAWTAQGCLQYTAGLPGGYGIAGNTACGNGPCGAGETANNCGFDCYR